MGQNVVSSNKTLGNQMLGSLAGVGSTLGVAYDQLDSVLSAYEAQYCTPAKFIPSVKKPAKFTGPGFELELSAGQCMFDDDELMGTFLDDCVCQLLNTWLCFTTKFWRILILFLIFSFLFAANNKKQLICEEPSITLIKTPANFTSKYKTAPKFVSKECKVRKEFGEPIQKVLYVFDGSGPVDLNAITTTVMNEIRSVTGSIGGAHQALAGQLTSFIGGIPNMGMGLKMPTFTY